MVNRVAKRLLWGLLTAEIILSLLVGCVSRQSDPVRTPLSTADTPSTATALVGVWGNASSAAGSSAAESADEAQQVIVYVTETGSKYHCSGCPYLAKSCIPMTLEQARQRYTPCSRCCPPT